MAEISIIIPVYNVENYIERCLDSIRTQTYGDFTVICVDDGSTDHSGEICDRYANMDHRITVFHIDNGGVSNARNFALKLVESAWFCFVDADDWIEPDYLEVLLNNANENGCDVSACSYRLDKEYLLNGDRLDSVSIYDHLQKRVEAYVCDGVSGMVWNKLYKSELLKGIRFTENVKVNEDCLYTQEVVETCSKICFTKNQLYHWFYREDSACHTKKINCDFSSADVFMNLYEKNKSFCNQKIDQKLFTNYVLSTLNTLFYCDKNENKTEYEKRRKQCIEISREYNIKFGRKDTLKLSVINYIPWMKKYVIKLLNKGK